MIAASPLLSLLACGPGVSLSGVDPHPTYLYAFELTGDFSTSARGPGGQPLPEAEGLPDRQLRLRGEVEIHYARGFRDGSEGHLVRFHEVQRAEGEGPWEESSLGGRSVELRVFDGGEILDAYELEHISGPGRDGAVRADPAGQVCIARRRVPTSSPRWTARGCCRPSPSFSRGPAATPRSNSACAAPCG